MNRRRFLGTISAVSAVAVCHPGLAGKARVSTKNRALNRMADLPGRTENMLGYPINMATPPDAFFAWQRKLAQVGLDRFAYNNVGNPYEHSHIPFNTHHMEKELIRRFGDLFHFDPDNTWGFLSNSGTDSNMHGLYFGRTILKGQTGILPKIYFTKEAHYSVQILSDLLGLEWVEVATLADGSMNPDDLERQLEAHPDHPALVCATVGTTFKGAVDSIDAIQAKLGARDAYLHVDAALFGGYLPHTDFAREVYQTERGVKRYDSMAVSCHKFFGFASPAGLFISTHKAFDEFHRLFSEVHDPEYILQVPGTISCSRDSVKPAEFYYHSTPAALKKQAVDAKACLANTHYLLNEMRNHYPHLQPVLENKLSNTVYFRYPGEAVVEKYSLATMNINRDGQPIPHAHVVVMPHATRPVLDRFMEDLA
ncbi:MAG: pyridoxal-dependent decarboxylase [Puniceicoccaceae bacterium]